MIGWIVFNLLVIDRKCGKEEGTAWGRKLGEERIKTDKCTHMLKTLTHKSTDVLLNVCIHTYKNIPVCMPPFIYLTK